MYGLHMPPRGGGWCLSTTLASNMNKPECHRDIGQHSCLCWYELSALSHAASLTADLLLVVLV